MDWALRLMNFYSTIRQRSSVYRSEFRDGDFLDDFLSPSSPLGLRLIESWTTDTLRPTQSQEIINS